MVEDRVTGGKRVAQLLASELSGREHGALGDVSVVDADPDAEPAPGGTRAYGVAVRGERVGSVVLYPGAAAVELAAGGTVDVEAVVSRGREAGLNAERDGAAATLRVESGAAVKRAVDALVAGLPG